MSEAGLAVQKDPGRMRFLACKPALKVVFTSGYSPGMAGKDISLLEGRNFLPKPYSIGKLAQFIREVLDREPAAN